MEIIRRKIRTLFEKIFCGQLIVFLCLITGTVSNCEAGQLKKRAQAGYMLVFRDWPEGKTRFSIKQDSEGWLATSETRLMLPYFGWKKSLTTGEDIFLYHPESLGETVHSQSRTRVDREGYLISYDSQIKSEKTEEIYLVMVKVTGKKLLYSAFAGGIIETAEIELVRKPFIIDNIFHVEHFQILTDSILDDTLEAEIEKGRKNNIFIIPYVIPCLMAMPVISEFSYGLAELRVGRKKNVTWPGFSGEIRGLRLLLADGAIINMGIDPVSGLIKVVDIPTHMLYLVPETEGFPEYGSEVMTIARQATQLFTLPLGKYIGSPVPLETLEIYLDAWLAVTGKEIVETPYQKFSGSIISSSEFPFLKCKRFKGYFSVKAVENRRNISTLPLPVKFNEAITRDAVDRLAAYIAGKSGNIFEAARNTCFWIYDNICYSSKIHKPEQCLASGEGDELSMSLLMVEVLGRLGIEARVVSGVRYLKGKLQPAAWVEVTDGKNTWPMDPSLAEADRFSASHIALAEGVFKIVHEPSNSIENFGEYEVRLIDCGFITVPEKLDSPVNNPFDTGEIVTYRCYGENNCFLGTSEILFRGSVDNIFYFATHVHYPGEKAGRESFCEWELLNMSRFKKYRDKEWKNGKLQKIKEISWNEGLTIECFLTDFEKQSCCFEHGETAEVIHTQIVLSADEPGYPKLPADKDELLQHILAANSVDEKKPLVEQYVFDAGINVVLTHLYMYCGTEEISLNSGKYEAKVVRMLPHPVTFYFGSDGIPLVVRQKKFEMRRLL